MSVFIFSAWAGFFPLLSVPLLPTPCTEALEYFRFYVPCLSYALLHLASGPCFLWTFSYVLKPISPLIVSYWSYLQLGFGFSNFILNCPSSSFTVLDFSSYMYLVFFAFQSTEMLHVYSVTLLKILAFLHNGGTCSEAYSKIVFYCPF